MEVLMAAIRSQKKQETEVQEGDKEAKEEGKSD